jgi:prepilin-type N-terminal cleavage/methylation domain-containing protein
MRKHQKGFSLIELLIVVAIILIIAAIAIPNFLRSRMQANEASAVASMRTINSAQIAYSVNWGGYSDSLAKMGPPATAGTAPDATHADVLDSVLGCGLARCNKSGYTFYISNFSGAPVNAYELAGVPIVPNSSGRRGFCSSQLIKIQFDPAGGTSCTADLQ